MSQYHWVGVCAHDRAAGAFRICLRGDDTYVTGAPQTSEPSMDVSPSMSASRVADYAEMILI